MNKFRLGMSPLTKTIYAGKVSKNNMWVGQKHDVTDDALMCVYEYIVIHGSPVFTLNDGSKVKLIVEKVTA